MIYPKALLFTGAGAHATLDLPTTPQFLKRIENDDIKIREKKLFNTLQSLSYVTDIEQVWYLLFQLENFNEQFEDSNLLNLYGRFAFLDRKIMGWSEFKQKAKSLKSDIEESLFDVYSLGPEIEQRAIDLYKSLLNNIIDMNINHNDEIPIFTTNYDRVVDTVYYEHFESLNWNFIDGFSKSGEDRKMDLSGFDRQLKKPTVKLFQLHGSLRSVLRNVNINSIFNLQSH